LSSFRPYEFIIPYVAAGSAAFLSIPRGLYAIIHPVIVKNIFREMGNHASCLLIPALLFLTCSFPYHTMGEPDRPVIGAEEYVRILPTDSLSRPALTREPQRHPSMPGYVRGRLHRHLHPASQVGGATITAPIVDWRYIRTSGSRERRPVIELELCIASRKLRARVNLNDRSGMRYPMLIGRNVITGNFLVDTSRSYSNSPKTEDTEVDR
jgi:hypothetical protein